MKLRSLGLAGIVAGALVAGTANAEPIPYSTWPYYRYEESQPIAKSIAFDLTYFEPGTYFLMIEKPDVCEMTGTFSLYRVGNRRGFQIPNTRQESSFPVLTSGDYEIFVCGSGKRFRLDRDFLGQKKDRFRLSPGDKIHLMKVGAGK